MTHLLFSSFLSILLTVSIVFSTQLFAAPSKQEKQNELKSIQKKINQLQQSIAVKQDSKNKTIKQLKSIEKNIGFLNTKIQKSNRSIQSSNKRLKKLHNDNKALKKELDKNKISLEKQIYGAYTQGRNSQLQMIFNQQNPAEFQRQLSFYQYIAKQQSTVINKVNKNLSDLETTRKNIEDENKRLKKTKNELVLQKQSLTKDKTKRSQVVKTLNTQLKKQGKHLKSLHEDEKQLKELIASINDIFKNHSQPQKPFKTLKGKLPWPLKGKLKTMYGHLKPLSNLKWQGNVIYAKEGTHVRAVSSGIVAYADWLKGFGNIIIIDHGDDYLSLYSHNQSLYKAPGEQVSKGEIISSAGNSGGIKKSGVYFEIRKKGKPQNPAIWCNSKNKFIS